MVTSALRRPLISILVAAVIFGCFPGTVGYARAIAWLPVYGAACHLTNIFGSAIEPDGYRVFLLGRGCDVDAAIREIVAQSGLDVDPAKVVAFYRHTQRPQSADEFLATELVRNSLREPAASYSGNSDCTPDGHCASPEFSEDHFIAKLVRGYLRYARAQFFFTENDGADYIVSILRMGTVMQTIAFLLYAVAVFALGRLVVGFVERLFPTRKTTAK